MEAEARKTAIDGVGDIPWGTHFCQFYRTGEELTDVLIPFFRAGLENNEFCLWITCEPLSAVDAHRALKEEVRNLDHYLRKGQVEILDHDQWHTGTGRFDPEEVWRGWIEKERFALERGFAGLRFTANASCIDKTLWQQFTNYEAHAHREIAGHRALGVCTYWLDQCSASEIIDVVSNHQFALIRQDGDWRIIESPAQKRTYEALRRSEQRYALAQRAANIGSWDWNIVTGDLHWSDRIEPLFGFAPGQFGATYEAFLECVHPDDRKHVVESANASIEQGDDYAVEHRIVWPNGTVRWMSETGDVIRDGQGKAVRMLGIVQDISEHKDREARHQLAGQILGSLTRKIVGTDLIGDVLKLIKQATGFDAVAIRRREQNDFPYFEVNGFPDDFVRAENHLCCRDEAGQLVCDAAGRPVVECMCGNVLLGRADPAYPFFTKGGSFWTNSSTELLAGTPPEALQVPTRNRCNQAGYESVALIPLRCGDEIVGLLQLNDTRRERFTPEMIRFFEEIGASIGIGLARIRAEQDAEILAKLPSESPNPIMRVAGDGLLLYANDASKPLLAEWGRALGQTVPDKWRQLIDEVYSSGLCRKLDSEVAGKAFSFVVVPVPSADYVNLYVRDITERKQAERELHLRNRIAEVFLTVADDRMYGEVLEILREALASEYGFFGYIDQAGDLVCPSLTRDIWNQCEMADKTIVFARDTWGDNIWARALTSTRSQLSNTPLKVPQGHVKVDRILSVPVVYNENSIGIIALANKSANYAASDQKLLESVAGFIAPVLDARLQRKTDLAEIESLARFPSENPNPVLRIARDGTVLYANAAGSRLVVGWGCKTGEQTPENWRQYIAGVLESGKNEVLEAFCEDRFFSLIVAPVKDAGYANVYGSDVTERRRAEESLREYRHHLEDLVQTRTAELTRANEKLMQEIEERKRLEKEILNISEQEQRRIGRELHDSIGQQFTGIAFERAS
ncbi:MAG: MEDS domain-containing protein [Planctomycetota bacterium]|jgi:PAS domain S-box-containing protein